MNIRKSCLRLPDELCADCEYQSMELCAVCHYEWGKIGHNATYVCHSRRSNAVLR